MSVRQQERAHHLVADRSGAGVPTRRIDQSQDFHRRAFPTRCLSRQRWSNWCDLLHNLTRAGQSSADDLIGRRSADSIIAGAEAPPHNNRRDICARLNPVIPSKKALAYEASLYMPPTNCPLTGSYRSFSRDCEVSCDDLEVDSCQRSTGTSSGAGRR